LLGLTFLATSLVVNVVAENPVAEGVSLVPRFVDARQKWEQTHYGYKAYQHDEDLPARSHGGSVALKRPRWKQEGKRKRRKSRYPANLPPLLKRLP
jgi:hypothetical protein